MNHVMGDQVSDKLNRRANSSSILSDSIRTIVIVFLAPTMVFYAVNKFIFIDRAFVNVDYFLVFLIVSPLGGTWCAIALSLVLLIDLTFSVAPAYYFSIESVLQSIHGLLELDSWFVLVEAAKLLSLGAGYFLVVKLVAPAIRKFRTSAVTCLVLAFTFIGLDQLFPLGTLGSENSALANPNLANSTLNNVRIAVTTHMQGHASNYSEPADSATIETGLLLPVEAGNQHIVLIVVESLGQLNDDALMRYQMEELTDLGTLPNVRVTAGSVDFHGSTVPGELRELCGIRMLVVRPDPKAIPVSDCLPALFHRQNYQTTAVHGFTGALFSRNIWYQALGFDDVLFAAQLKNTFSVTERCGLAFHGYCDVSIWKFIESRLGTSSNPQFSQFIYWLTLTTHLPVEPASKKELANCSMFPQLESAPKACALISDLKDLFKTIANSVLAGNLKNTKIVLVGDHSPPFLTDDARALFSQTALPHIEIETVLDKSPDG